MIAKIGEVNILAFETPGEELVDSRATKLLTEDDDERGLSEDGLAEIGFSGIEESATQFLAIAIGKFW